MGGGRSLGNPPCAFDPGRIAEDPRRLLFEQGCSQCSDSLMVFGAEQPLMLQISSTGTRRVTT